MHAGGSTVTLVVRCEQEPCTRRGRVFNEIVVPLGMNSWRPTRATSKYGHGASYWRRRTRHFGGSRNNSCGSWDCEARPFVAEVIGP